MVVTYNWLKEFVDISVKPAELADKLTMSGFEVESLAIHDDDAVMDINVTPNRGDCLSILGIAREVAAITGKKLEHKNLGKQERGAQKIKEFVSVEIKDKKKCPRYAAGVVQNLKIGPSPDWLAKRLEACGIRSINNVVDATNYVMIETGQPFHAFDLRYVRGQKIIVRQAGSDAEFVTLDGEKRKLISEDLLICDAEGPVALAGVMGGANSEVKPDTTSVLLESAYFEPSTVRRTSKRLGLGSESSRRFERGVDGTATLENLERLTSLIIKIAGGTPAQDFIDINSLNVTPANINITPKDVSDLLGVDVKASDIKNYLSSLGIAYENDVCTVPSYRPDITRPVDIAEEVARLHGYDKIPVSRPSFEMTAIQKPLAFNYRVRAREFFKANGFYEAVNYGFCSPSDIEPFEKEPVKLANPLGVEFSAMTPTLLAGLLNNLRLNLNMGAESVRLFEIRPVFLKNAKLAETEERRLSGVMYGRRTDLTWSFKEADVDFFDVKGVCETLIKHLGISEIKFVKQEKYSFLHPKASALIIVNGKEVGSCGLLHPSVAAKWDVKKDACVFELNWDLLVAEADKVRRSFKALERFPTVRRDVALLLNDSVQSNDILSSIKDFGSAIIQRAMPFDVYKGKGIPEGKKSVAYAVMYYDSTRTLTDEVVGETHSKLISYLKDKLGAEVR